MRLITLLVCCFFQVTRSQNVDISNRDDLAAQTYNINQLEANPFLSATLSTTITYNPETASLQSSSPFHLDFDSTRKLTFSKTLTKFLTKIFSDQQAYDLRILSVNIFDDHVLHDGATLKKTIRGDTSQKAFAFSMVVSAEYTNASQIGTMTSQDFSNVLVHVCHKFQSHLIEYMQETGDPYFTEVDSIVVGMFQKMNVENVEVDENAHYLVLGMPRDQLNTASIITIVVGGILFILLSFASFKLYRRAMELRADRLGSKELGPSNTDTNTSLSSSNRTGRACYEVVPDDYSFNPTEMNNGYNIRSSYNRNWRNESNSLNSSLKSSPIWPESSPPGQQISYTDELRYLPKQHVFAPPGKIGVAIDVLNGQPVVHKVRKGSPLEKMLQPNDIILAIDDEDTSCLSAADVTNMMVKRIDRVRKITFVRRDNCPSMMDI